MEVELIKTIGYLIIYPIAIVWVSIRIAKFHFEKDIKKQYLVAKDKVANDILNSTCGMLLNMWELANINKWISNGEMKADDQKTIERKEAELNNFYKFTAQSYSQLGQMGLYYGTAIVEQIAVLQSELNAMINNNNFAAFKNEDWDNFRRQKLLPILQLVHNELKETIFDRVKSFRLYT